MPRLCKGGNGDVVLLQNIHDRHAFMTLTFTIEIEHIYIEKTLNRLLPNGRCCFLKGS